MASRLCAILQQDIIWTNADLLVTLFGGKAYMKFAS